MSQCKVLFLSYGYMPTGRIEPYRERLIKVLAGAGCKVLAIKTNSFFQEFSHEPLFANAIAPLVSEIEQFQPDVVISINRTGLSPEILAATSGAPIITLFRTRIITRRRRCCSSASGTSFASSFQTRNSSSRN